LAGVNVLHCSIKTKEIIEKVNQIKDLPKLDNKNIYGDGYTADKIIEVLKKGNYLI
jgi:hypothetical protein